MMVGIVSYGIYIPRWRIKVEEIAKVWSQDPERYKTNLLVDEKSVPSIDEDAATMAVEAAGNALNAVPQIDRKDIGALYVGSESHPYAVKPTATIVAEALGITPSLTAADTEFACKAATAAIQMCMGLVKAGYVKYGVSIGTDAAQGRPADVLEYTAAAGAAAYLIGEDDVLATIEGTFSLTQDVSDFWRREGAEFPQHAGRFTGEPAYFAHVVDCSRELMKKLGTKSGDYDYAVFHEPNGMFPLMAARMLDFDEKKVMPSLIVKKIGNTYSASVLIGLASILDQAKSGTRILVTSYGSGAGSDAFSLLVTDQIEKRRKLVKPVEYYVKNKQYIDYSTYSRFKNQIRGYPE